MMKKFISILIILLFIIISISCLSLKGEKTMDVDARALANYINTQVDAKIPSQTATWYSATVISTSGGLVTVHLPTDPVGTNIVVQNPNSISIENDDQVVIRCIGTNMSNAIVESRKTVSFDDIYIDYTNGVDAYGYDSSGNQYGSVGAPFKTLKYAMRRLPKNLNNRDITITIVDAPSGGGDSVLFTDGFYGGNLTIQGLENKYADVKDMWLSNCSASVSLYYLNGYTASGLFGLFAFYNCSSIYLYSCNAINPNTYNVGISANNHSYVRINDCTISNQSTAAIRAQDGSIVFASYNDGINNGTVFVAKDAGYIGVDSDEPSGTTRASADASSTIKP